MPASGGPHLHRQAELLGVFAGLVLAGTERVTDAPRAAAVGHPHARRAAARAGIRERYREHADAGGLLKHRHPVVR